MLNVLMFVYFVDIKISHFFNIVSKNGMSSSVMKI
jgi:hypothetical protein